MWYQEILAEIVVTIMVPIAVWILSELRRRSPGIILKTVVVLNALLQTFFMIELPDRLKNIDQFTIRAVVVFIVMMTMSYLLAFREGKSELEKTIWKAPKRTRKKKIRTRKQPKIYRSKKSKRKQREEL